MRRDDRGVVLGLYRSGPDRELIERALSLGVRGLDTAYNYRRFTSHKVLAHVAGDLLGNFTLSTKVGFFPSSEPAACAVHRMDPHSLRLALEQSAEDLGRKPDVVFLHNPERTLEFTTGARGRDMLLAACGELERATREGLCGRWGVASWDPRPVVAVLADGGMVRPDVVMVRSGLTVADVILRASERMCELFEVPPDRRWGMSPFGGSAADEVWRTTRLDAFLRPNQQWSTLQAALRMAFELPEVRRVAVGTASAEHLAASVDAVDFELAEGSVRRYREIIRDADRQQSP